MSARTATREGSTIGTRVLLRFAKPAAGAMVVASLLAAISSILELAPFYFLYRAVLLIVEGGDSSRLVTFGLAAGAAAAAQALTWSAAMYVSHIAAYKQLHTLRVELLDRFTRLPLGEVSGQHSGDLQRVVVDDVFQLEVFVSHSLPEFVSSMVSWIVVTVWLFSVDARLTVVTATVIVIAWIILLIGSRPSAKYMAWSKEAAGRLSRGLVELLDGLLTAAVLDRSGKPSASLGEAIDEVADANSEWESKFAPFGTAYLVLIGAPALLLVPIGGAMVVAGAASPSDLLLFLIIGLGYGAPILRLRRIYYQLNLISYAAGVIDEVLTTEVQQDSPGPAPVHGTDIEFKEVGFSYGEEKVLEDISFHAAEGSLTAIVGPTGAGKSTIARLTARFWDVETGQIRLGGHDVRSLPIEHLLSQISFVFQDTFLFRDTIKANLLVGRPGATDSEVESSCKAANIHDTIVGLPNGYDTMLESRGANLSGGERQRLAIARALLHDTPVVILDEATAFVDPDSEAVLREALHALTVGRTVLVIAHRLSTIIDADQIIVVSGGRIVQKGKHAELISKPGVYKELWTDWQRTDPVAI